MTLRELAAARTGRPADSAGLSRAHGSAPGEGLRAMESQLLSWCHPPAVQGASEGKRQATQGASAPACFRSSFTLKGACTRLAGIACVALLVLSLAAFPCRAPAMRADMGRCDLTSNLLFVSLGCLACLCLVGTGACWDTGSTSSSESARALHHTTLRSTTLGLPFV